MFCIECEYPAEDIYDLGENYDYEETCHYCGNQFKDKSNLMLHNKRAHSDKVSKCRHYEAGHCPFVDSECWFSHIETPKKSPESFTCGICGNRFKTRSDFMQHRKREHLKEIQYCRDQYGNCKFGKLKCWFRHPEIEFNDENSENVENRNQNNGNQNIIEKLFDMVEKFTSRITELENKIA